MTTAWSIAEPCRLDWASPTRIRIGYSGCERWLLDQTNITQIPPTAAYSGSSTDFLLNALNGFHDFLSSVATKEKNNVKTALPS